MAGSLALIPTEQVRKPASTFEHQHQWQVSFSRYFIHPLLPSTCSSLVPRSNSRRNRGTWISSRSPSASVQLLNSHSPSLAILAVHLRDTVIEEHYVWKLNFIWPQVSCVSGYPARGSRVVFMSYKDSVNEIQKFALRFSDTAEAETFMDVLKDILKDFTETEPVNSDFRSEISSHSAFMSTSRSPSRAPEEKPSLMSPIQINPPQLPLSLNYEVRRELCSEETPLNCDSEGISHALPPNFASFLTNCCSEVKQAAAQPSSSEEIDLKSQIARFMEDPSFQEMLVKVEKVISEIGDDLML